MSSGRLAEALSKAYLHWQTQPASAKATPPAFTVALSRQSGAGGGTIARAVGARLGWSVYDRELLQKIGDEMGLQATLLERVDEKRESWLGECLEALASTPSVNESAYVRRLVKTILALAVQGECVIVGRGAAQILPPEITLRVRLIGPRQARIAARQRQLGISEEEARRVVDATDHQRTDFVRDHFHRDPTDPENYDLVLNSQRFSAEECAELIIEALHRLQLRASKSQSVHGRRIRDTSEAGALR